MKDLCFSVIENLDFLEFNEFINFKIDRVSYNIFLFDKVFRENEILLEIEDILCNFEELDDCVVIFMNNFFFLK